MVIYNLPCLKRRKGNEANRNIAVNIEREKEFIEILIKWINKVEMDDYIFNIGRKQAYVIVRKFKDELFPHYFRHLRCSHLTTQYGFSSADLRQYTGWTDDKPAAQYVHLNWREVARKMM